MREDFKKVFGMLLIYLRKSSFDLEYSILSNVTDVNEKNGVIYIGVSDEFGYNKLQLEIKETINEFFEKHNYKCEIVKTQAQEKVNVLDLLKEKFGKYLKVVR